ncbi:MAG: DNA polymerase III subunit gamma/tau [Clostridia bacterium]|nr:DNA polymerase III subunit gamma/tau [Clostridia bacterium]
MYKALYRKWRPSDFDSVCGQEHITDVLKYQVADGRVSHAYLFCGSRGTGKTSCAKILAKAVNCLNPKDGNPCNECAACVSINKGLATDVIEMDAASNNGVDNVRDIKEEVVYSPAELKYRVYIIDEVHMLSASAFNALLKTLGEPPSHVIFILATTELQKLPSTIVSRCQHYDFRRLSAKVLVDRLAFIAEQEGIVLENAAALMIARMAAGGMRDAISLFELCAGSGKEVTAETCAEILGVGNRDAVFSMVEAIIAKDYGTLYRKVAENVMESRDLTVFWQELIDTYRDMMVVKTSGEAATYLDLTEGEYTALRGLAEKMSLETMVYHSKLMEEALYAIQRVGLSKRSTIELALTRMCEPRLSASYEALLARIARLEDEISRLRLGIPVAPVTPTETEAAPKQESKPVKAETPVPEPSAEKQPMKNDKESFKALTYWRELVEALGERKPSVAGILGKSKAYYSASQGFLITFPSDFFVSIINKPDTLLDIKSKISEYEDRNIMTDPFEITSSAKTESYHLIDELEAAIDEE